jgi:hypothetical protein
METQFVTGDSGGSPYVSTGRLPTPEQVAALVAEAHARFKSNRDGENSQVYPGLAGVSKELFGVCVVGTSGNVLRYGLPVHDHERLEAFCVRSCVRGHFASPFFCFARPRC